MCPLLIYLRNLLRLTYVFIKDGGKSSNGTFIDSERLCAEGVESEPFELKTGDIVVGHNPAFEMYNAELATRISVLT